MLWLALVGVVIILVVAWFFLSPPKSEPAPPVAPRASSHKSSGARASTSKASGARAARGERPAAGKASAAPAAEASAAPVKSKADEGEGEARKSGARVSSVPPPSSSRPSRAALPRLRPHGEGDEEDGNTSLTMLGAVIDAPGQGTVRTLSPGADVEEATLLHALTLVTAAAQTDKGMRRKHNEDSYLLLPDQGVFLVADGMGGHQAGEVASQIAAQTTAEVFRSGEFPGEPDERLPNGADELRRVIEHANASIFARAQQESGLHGMGTTVVAARFSATKRRASIAYVGDSRCYRRREGRFEQLTTDHTIGSVTGVVGSLGERLTRAVGIAPAVSVDVLLDATQPGDVYLLCSDGLSKMVPDETLDRELSDVADLPAAAQRLIDLANQSGGRDNITVVLVRVDPPASS